MKKIKFGIKTKIVSLLSVLMALVLAIQFYFTAQAQDDVLQELTRLSSSMKRATDVNFFRGLPPYAPLPEPEEDEEIEELMRRVHNDKIYQLRVKDGKISADTVNDLPVVITSDQDDDYNILVKQVKRWTPDTMLVTSGYKPYKYNSHYSINKDSLTWVVEEVEVNLEKPEKKYHKRSTGVTAVSGKLAELKEKHRPATSFQFVIPDFSKPQNPRLMRFNYNATVFEDMMEDIRDRNILITLSLFILSIAAIVAMTRKVLNPIDRLQQSFNEVVAGNLEVEVPSQANDEIGDLTRSFNHMVLELKKNKEKEALLQRKERLASLGQLAAGVAHEVKNPLNAINLTIDHLGDKFVDRKDTKALKYIHTIQAEIKRLDKIVNNFFNYLRSEELTLKEVDLHALLNEVVSLFEREMEADGINPVIKLSGDFRVKIDEARFKTALMNIVLNAIQAMPKGGTLTVRTDRKQKQIIVADTGGGIDPKEAEHIFDLFYTTKSSGTGLGLPTAYKIIKAHGGEIQMDSNPGKGTRVTIQL